MHASIPDPHPLGEGPVALVTGGNRGLGFAVCRELATRGLSVVLGARDERNGAEAETELSRQGLTVASVALDVSSRASVEACATRLREAGADVRVLVNNAGVYLADDMHDALQLSESVLMQTLEVNLLGALRACQAFMPGMIRVGYGRVVNISSDCGSMAEMKPDDAASAYRISKAALNALTRLLAGLFEADVEHRLYPPADIKVNALHPGWVQTDMGRATGDPPITPHQAAETVAWLATLPSDGPSNGFFFGREPYPW